MVIYVDNPKYIIPDQNVAKEMADGDMCLSGGNICNVK